MTDPLARLSDLRPAEPTPERAATIRMRCRTELARRAPRADPLTARPVRLGGSRLWQAAIASLCVAYVTEVIVLAVEVLQAR